MDTEGTSYRSELRCAASPELFVMLDQVRRVLSVEKDDAVTTAEVLEMGLLTESEFTGPELTEVVRSKVTGRCS